MSRYVHAGREKEQKLTPVIRPMSMETRSSKVFFEYIALKKEPKKIMYRRCGEKREKTFILFYFFPQPLQAAQLVFFWSQIVNTVIETSSCDDRRSIST